MKFITAIAVLASITLVTGQRMKFNAVNRPNIKPLPPAGKELDFPTCQEATETCKTTCKGKDSKYMRNVVCLDNSSGEVVATTLNCKCSDKGEFVPIDKANNIRDKAAKIKANSVASGKPVYAFTKDYSPKGPQFQVDAGQEPDLSFLSNLPIDLN